MKNLSIFLTNSIYFYCLKFIINCIINRCTENKSLPFFHEIQLTTSIIKLFNFSTREMRFCGYFQLKFIKGNMRLHVLFAIVSFIITIECSSAKIRSRDEVLEILRNRRQHPTEVAENSDYDSLNSNSNAITNEIEESPTRPLFNQVLDADVQVELVEMESLKGVEENSTETATVEIDDSLYVE